MPPAAATREILTRRNLPHWYVPGALHFLTFRLAGTLPRELIEDLVRRKDQWLREKPKTGITSSEHRHWVHKQLFVLYEDYLDRNCGVDWLRDARIAALVRSSLYHLHGANLQLLAYCVMPNHVHVVFLPLGVPLPCETATTAQDVGETADAKSSLSSIMHSLKSYTAHEANKILRRSGAFWQHESYDHWIRDEDELERVVAYINANPVKAELASPPQDWFWCSAHDRYLTDGDTCGMLRLKT